MKNDSLYLNEYQMMAVYGILVTQFTGMLSNIICIYIVYQIKDVRFNSRPKVLMSNIAVSDTILTLNTIFPRLAIMKLIADHPISAHVFQSIRNYLDNITLYITSFTFTLIACDRYYAITKIFNNPFDGISTKKLLAIVWCSSLVLSLPFVITSEIDFYDFNTSTLYCFNDGLYLSELSSDKTFVLSTRIFTIFIDFLLPTLLVTWFTIQMIYKLFDDYRQSLLGIQVNHDLKRCEITKRFGLNFDFRERYPSSCRLTQSYYFFYIAFRTTTSFNSLIFFWLSSQFRQQLCDYWRKTTTNSL
ncbi:tachykinin-like peptides receptor 86C [Oppia nitens]|uniref:tachykinin-like peptides receptor 86C n=1 Tax=Oppia nitens TaxID=1686743 RepID=UPI0023DB7823|nr:tachykinin-like peptides receptor 86C [Oppia nitens]